MLHKFIWSVVGTDSRVLQQIGYRDRMARICLGFSLIITTVLATIAAASLLRIVTAEQVSATQYVVVALGSAAYGCIIYMMDMSIITATRAPYRQITIRLLMAIFLSFVVGSQINIALHEELLVAELKRKIYRSDGKVIEKNLYDNANEMRRLEFLRAQLGGEERDTLQEIASWEFSAPSITDQMTALKRESTALEQAIQVLRCAYPLEVVGQRWQQTCLPTAPNHHIVMLRLRETGIRGPAAGCRERSEAVVCRMERAMTSLSEEYRNVIKQINDLAQKTAPTNRAMRIESLKQEISRIRDQINDLTKEIEFIRGVLNRNREDLDRLMKRANESIIEMHALFWEIAIGLHDSDAITATTKLWLWVMIALIFLIDLFVLILKVSWPSPVYDFAIENSQSFNQMRSLAAAVEEDERAR